MGALSAARTSLNKLLRLMPQTTSSSTAASAIRTVCFVFASHSLFQIDEKSGTSHLARVQEEADQPSNELSNDPPKRGFKWFLIGCLVFAGVGEATGYLKVNHVAGIQALLVAAVALLFVASPLHDKLPRFLQGALLLLIFIGGYEASQIWFEPRLRAWLNMPDQFEQLKVPQTPSSSNGR